MRISFAERAPFHSLASQSSITLTLIYIYLYIFLPSQSSPLKHVNFCNLKPGFFVVSTPTKHLACFSPQSDQSLAEVPQALAHQALAALGYIKSLRLIIMRIRFRASDFGLDAKINIICAKSKQASCAEMVLGPFVFSLV